MESAGSLSFDWQARIRAGAIRGELIKLGYLVSATSIRNLMRKHGVPTPRDDRA